MAQDIIEDLTPITEGLQEINRNLDAKKEPPRPNIGSKGRFVSDYGPPTETYLREYMDDTVKDMFFLSTKMQVIDVFRILVT